MNKYLFFISFAMNAVLLMAVAGVLPFLLFLSISFSIALIWFIRRILRQLRFAKEDMTTIKGIVESFGEHAHAIHEMEMYYGDETLKALLRHSRAVSSDLEYVMEKYLFEDEGGASGEEEEE